MSQITVDYKELKSNYAYVYNKINELLTIVESINEDCKKICSEECWDGALSDSFNSMKSRMNDFAVQSILAFKKTEEFKNFTTITFKEVEKENSNKYV